MQDHVRGEIAYSKPEWDVKIELVRIAIHRDEAHHFCVCWRSHLCSSCCCIIAVGDIVIAVFDAFVMQILFGDEAAAAGIVVERFPDVAKDNNGHIAAPDETAREESGDETNAVDELR